MRKGVLVWIGLIVCIIIGIAIIDAGVTRPIDWRKSYNIRDKIPFGAYVLHKELGNILGKDRVYKDFGDSFYEEIERLDSAKNYKATLMVVDEYFNLEDEDVRKLYAYVENGGEVFVSALYFGETLMDTLGISSERLDYPRFLPNDERITYSLGKDTERMKVDKVDDFRVFTKLQSTNSTVLGYLHSRGRALPNFVKISLGKGYLYLHNLPDVFTNYHMLKEDKYAYASKVLNVIQHKEILFADAYYEWERPATPLRVILTQPGFYQAWYLLLVGLLALLIFKSKREQRAVRVVKPEPNLSKEFAKTIGNLYYENGQPGNIIHKKIDYFLYAIRSGYHLDTLELLDEKFLKVLSLKSGVSLEETKTLMHMLYNYQKSALHHVDDVKIVNSSIEEFKQKANIL